MPDGTIFPKGTTFTCSTYLPDTIPPGFFEGWELQSQLRRRGNITDLGIIAELDVAWFDPGINRQLTFYFKDTLKWPVGPAQFDVLLTNAAGESFRTSPVEILITSGVTIP